MSLVAAVALSGAAIASSQAAAQPVQQDAETATFTLSPAQLFELAESARARGDYAVAEEALRALTEDPRLEIRNEARFRLAMLLADDLERYQDAAVLLRRILDEQPETARVRVELARMQATMGNMREAERELRAAQAAGLPPEVEQLVRFYASALASRKPFGFNAELAIAPDTNINRATRSDTLETIIGDFRLNEDARERSGVGIATRGQAYFREGLEEGIDLLVRGSASGRFYRESDFDDYTVSIQAGPQYALGADRLDLAAVVSWRWFGREPYSVSYGGSGNFRHPLDRRTQLRLDGAIVHTDDRLNDLRSNDRFSLAAGVDHAFSAKFGGGMRLSGYRSHANDPGYSNASGGVDAYLFRELGQITAVAAAGYERLESDRRLFLYPARRVDDRVEASISATFRNFRVGAFSPLARISFERNYSTVEIFDYRRVAAEFGITAAY